MRGEVIAEPLREGDISPVTDGACAVVLERAENARDKKGVRIAGVGLGTETYYPFWRDLSVLNAAVQASRVAFERTGWSVDDVDYFEVVERTPYHEAMLAEAIGMKVRDYLDGGMKKFNLSGGALAADPEPATGLVRIVEAAGILTGKYNLDAERVLTVSGSGLGYQTCIAFALEKE